MKYLAVLVIGVLLCGCASQGRFAAIDFDLRTPEQITAYEEEAKIVYETASETPQTDGLKADTPSESPWYFVFDFLKVMQGRLRFISFEWSSNE